MLNLQNDPQIINKTKKNKAGHFSWSENIVFEGKSWQNYFY